MPEDPIAQNIEGVRSLIGSRTNKVPGGVTDSQEGVSGEFIDVLTLKLDDEELLRLRDEWESRYIGYESRIKGIAKRNKAYYLGKQYEGTSEVSEQPIAANLLFEAEETFLPAALSKNPEPVVYAGDNSEQANKIANDVKSMLQFHADQLVLRRKLTLMVRQWSIYHLGVIKHGWDENIKDISSEVRKIQDFIFDPDGYVDCYGDFIGYLGERITVTAEKLLELFPKHKAYILVKADGKLGTNLTYTEWWTDEFCFFTFEDIVLDKHKNEHFNYSQATNEHVQLIDHIAKNQFAKPKKPYTFLSVFSLGEQPHDITGLIEQNVPNQNLVSKRTKQIDKAFDKTLSADLFSENNFTQQTAKQAANALDGNGSGKVLIPAGGPINEAIVRLPAIPVNDSYFKDLDVNKDNLRSIFGVQGITAQKPNEDTTARGMILNQQYDNTRIGGGIGDAIEQVADNIFNWWVQLYYVYYDEPHDAAIMGQMKAVEYVTLSAQDLGRKLIISVAPDSMKPKDELTQMNQAMQLWEAGALDPKTLLTMLNFADPQTTSENTVLWLLDKNAYMQMNFPQLAQQLAQLQQQTQAAAGAQAPQGGAASESATPPPSLGGEPANASLSQVPLPQ